MGEEDLLEDKLILVVDDEPDILEAVGEMLEAATVHKAVDYDTARQYIQSYTYDIVILDIMGVHGYELLKNCVTRGFPTVMLTAHSLTPESLKKSIKLGAVSFIPKEELPRLRSHLEDVVLGEGKPVWEKVFHKLESFFNKRFGPDWRERDQFFKEFEEAMRSGGSPQEGKSNF
jgi:CheY-like chemotaxis protein